MRVLVLSKSGDGISLAHKIVKEGHDVKMFIQDSNYTLSGNGIVNRVPSWRPHLPTTDLVICDAPGFSQYSRVFKTCGIPTFCCSALADMVYKDYWKQLEILNKAGIRTPMRVEFDSIEAVRDLEPSWGDGYTITSEGKSFDIRDVRSLDWYINKISTNKPVIVTEIINGVDLVVEGWFNGRDWLSPFLYIFNETRMLRGGKGPEIDSMGTLVVTKRGDKITQESLLKLSPFLLKVGYKGPVRIGLSITGDKIVGKSLSFNIGYDSIDALSEGLKEPITDLVFETALGSRKNMRIWSEFLISVRLLLSSVTDRGRPILIDDSGALDHILFSDLYQNDSGLHFAGGKGVLAKVTARGCDVREASRRVYRTIKNLNIENAQFRDDIGARVPQDTEKLKSWGYLNV